MAETLSFTPNRPADDRAARPVRRRHVLYVPGYDPEAESRSRMIFVRELLRYAKRFGLVERSIGPVEPCPEIPALRWNVTAAKAGWRTETVVEVLRWDDIVIRDFARPLPLAAALLFTAFLHSIAAGTLFRFFRLNWKFGGVIVYPPVMVATTLGLGALLGAALARLLALWVPLPGWAGLAAALAGALGGLKLAGPLGRRWFVWHLTHDWVFNWQHGIGRRADYEARVERFSRRIRDVVQAGEADEIVVLGHSSGAIMAVEAVADAL
ncbi:MAG: alpha/beta hydrolase, partial [Methylobacteriaceae bacterium]|nr:alpha/beta hydrolase [Methylobacteriaceae bacterium]